MSPPSRSPQPYPKWFAWAVGLILLLFPLVMGLLLGWWGLDPQTGEEFSSPGQDAHNLLNGWPDSNLVVDIAAQEGYAPPANALSALSNAINATCDKFSVVFEVTTFNTTDTSLSDSDLWDLELAQRTSWPSVGTMSLFYLVVGASYSGASFEGTGAVVLGVTYLASSIAIFAGTIESAAGSVEYPYIYATVMVHELGHELGLVGIIGSAPNEDPSHPYHSSDPSDIMYWEVGTTSYLGGVLGGTSTPTTFSPADMSDLQTVRATPILSEVLPWVVSLSAWGGLVVFVAARWWRRRVPAPPPDPRRP